MKKAINLCALTVFLLCGQLLHAQISGDGFDLTKSYIYPYSQNDEPPLLSMYNWELNYLSSSNSSETLSFKYNGTEKMQFKSNQISTAVLFKPNAGVFTAGQIRTTSNLIADQKIGIGTASPTEALTINNGFGQADGFIVFGSSSASQSSWNQPWYGLSTADESFLDFRTDANNSRPVLLQGFYGLAFRTDKGTMAMDNDGIVSIGLNKAEMESLASATNAFHNFKLYVAGAIRTEEAQIDLKTNWPDYVFSEEYKLRPLSEVETFIQQNHHLPEVPSAKEVAENGIMVGEMNATLLKKIEELTLYTLQLNSEIKKLQKESQELKDLIVNSKK